MTDAYAPVATMLAKVAARIHGTWFFVIQITMLILPRSGEQHE